MKSVFYIFNIYLEIIIDIFYFRKFNENNSIENEDHVLS